MRRLKLVPRRWARSQMDSSVGASPQAARLRSPRWSDFRLWVGIALIVASMFAGARLLSQGSDAVTVWAAERDLSVGAQQLQLRPVTVSLGSVEADYLPATEQPTGALQVPIAEGELIPRSALAAPESEPTRKVTVGVDPMHAPVGLLPGDVVDIWSTPKPDTGLGGGTGSPDPFLVLSGVSVDHVAEDSLGLSGQFAVVLQVRPDDVLEVVKAARMGSVDLVTVPVESQLSANVADDQPNLSAAER